MPICVLIHVQMPDVMLEATHVPQADDLSRVIRYVRAVSTYESSQEEAGFEGRDAQYYAHAARILGLIDVVGTITSVGRSVIDAHEPLERIAECFEATPVARAWAEFANAESVWDVDAESAASMLATISGLAESTTQRRASTLRAWHTALAPIARARPSKDELRARLLDRSVFDLPLPTRFENFARRQGIETVRELIVLGPRGLAAAKHLGRTSITALDRILRERGARDGLEALHAFVTPTPVIEEGGAAEPPRTWDGLSVYIPLSLRDAPLTLVDLPTRLESFCARQGITTLGPLVARRAHDLLAEPNIGRSSIRDGFVAILAAIERMKAAPGAPPDDAERGSAHSQWLGTFSLDAFPTYEHVFQSVIERLPFQQRLIITRRTGFVGTASTLLEIGELLGVSRERVRQIEAVAMTTLLRDTRWAEAITARLGEALGAQARTLTELADDPFFAPAAESPKRFRYLVERVLSAELSIVEWDGGLVLAQGSVKDADEAFLTFLKERPSRSFPMTRAALEAEAYAEGEALSPGFGSLFVDRIDSAFVFDASGESALGYGNSRYERMRAFIRARGTAVRVTELVERFGRFPLLDDFIHVERGLVTLPENLADFALWQGRLVPQCLRIMEERGPDLQWMAGDLLDALREVAQLPPYITAWVLAGMLRQSKACADLGRTRFALFGASDEGRIQFMPTLTHILEEAGRPMTRDALRAELAKLTTFSELTFSLSVVRLPLLPIDGEQIGLVDRDVPGGRAMLESAGELLEHALEERGIGMTFAEAATHLAKHAQDLPSLTRAHVAAVARLSSTITSNRVGVGLASWESVRVLSRAELLRKLVDEGEGEAKVDVVIEAFEARECGPVSRGAVYSTVVQLGMRVEQGIIRERSLAKTVPPPLPGAPTGVEHLPPPPGLPALNEIGIPTSARGYFAALLREPPEHWDALLAACEAHTEKIAEHCLSNMSISFKDAHALLASTRALVERARGETNGVFRSLAWAAVRYFELHDDAESDFSIGGLDDDVAVMNAVVTHLGIPELRIELTA